jgi:hypothetical protein
MRALALHLTLAAGAVLPLPAPARASGPWHSARQSRASVDARAETPDGVVPAVVKVMCLGGDVDSVCVTMLVEDTAQVASFDFAAFEGPDAAAAKVPLFSARVGETAVEGPVSGRTVDDPPGSFSFEFCGPRGAASGAKTLAHAIAAGPGDLEIAIAHPARDGRAIRARVPADAPGGEVSRALERCPADR